ncbi:GNAT family N-acetyltransferase [Raineyella sp. W15-4]|uniref:GNAT family N-acetyltransferase n=1 Tax=Raineyella sp. W15-4 TaxID=3081651 RepID=UPI002955C104|nr:GNAT family N-acetyltransferase [Raineyella sp. W15-4]WOQ17356.1 GNAT family N-acetyltransferase [Raineyella sp. W15-4]
MHGPTARTLPDGAIVRTATPSDVPAILDRIRDLAVYEHKPDAVENTEERLHGVLFGERPSVFAHVVDRDGVIAGIAIWFLNYSTWTGTNGIFLEDLFVAESERGRGYGLALMRELAAIAVERGYARVEWSVLDWNAPSIAFYRTIGAVGMDDWTGQRLTGDALRALGGR